MSKFKSKATSKKVAAARPIGTKSFLLYECFKTQKGKATVTQLAKAISVPKNQVSFYIGELKRVYGIAIEHERGSPNYTITDLKVVIPKTGRRGFHLRRHNRRSIKSAHRAGAASILLNVPSSKRRKGESAVSRHMEALRHVINQNIDQITSRLGTALNGSERVAIPVEEYDRLRGRGAPVRRQTSAVAH